ncbi:MAG: tetratricopeptide repeat protein, partial [Acidobacteria bacterium]|nr:tetratricopeptide repeat protein [Acidobacteriota bacterium]
AVEPDEEVSEMLRSLGYLSGATSTGVREGTLDPKDGIALARDYEQARALLKAGHSGEARGKLERLVQRSPNSVPFLTAYAAALQAAGGDQAAIDVLRQATELNAGNDLLQLQLGDAHLHAGNLEEARARYQLVLELNPRSARAWLGLADLAHRRQDPAEERRLLDRALAAGTSSALILTRLGQIELATRELASAERHLEEATHLVPGLASAWWVWGEAAEADGRLEVAAARFARAVAGAAEDEAALRHLGQLLRELGREAEAGVYLDRAKALEEQRRPGTGASTTTPSPSGSTPRSSAAPS